MEEAQIVEDVELADHLSKSMFLELKKLAGKLKEERRDNFTISPVPSKFRQSKENLFDPSVISIGPLHHGKESLKAMEDQKWRSLLDFLSREDHISLDLCLAEMRLLEERTRRCYSESVPLDSNSFVKMMLLDGCFVLEYFLKLLYKYDHPVFILSDLILFENQIPFFIVERLCEIGLKPDTTRDFKNHLVNVIFARAEPAVVNPPAEIHHLVHLCYHCLIPINPSKPVVLSSESFGRSMLGTINNLLFEFFLWVFIRIFPKSNAKVLYDPNSSWRVIPCATMLHDAGIELRPKSNPHHMLDISYDHGVLEIPRLPITNEYKTVFANIISFEKSEKLSANLSSFALFLDSLVNTPEDLKILHNCGIVSNYGEEYLIDFFNQICEGMDVERDHYLAELFVEVNKYCKKRWSRPRERWNRNKEQLIDEYFKNPWTTISLVGAVLVVLFTFVQTFFAVLAYFVPPS